MDLSYSNSSTGDVVDLKRSHADPRLYRTFAVPRGVAYACNSSIYNSYTVNATSLIGFEGSVFQFLSVQVKQVCLSFCDFFYNFEVMQSMECTMLIVLSHRIYGHGSLVPRLHPPAYYRQVSYSFQAPPPSFLSQSVNTSDNKVFKNFAIISWGVEPGNEATIMYLTE